MSHRWWWERGGGEWGRFSSSSALSLTEKSPPSVMLAQETIRYKNREKINFPKNSFQNQYLIAGEATLRYVTDHGQAAQLR